MRERMVENYVSSYFSAAENYASVSRGQLVHVFACFCITSTFFFRKRCRNDVWKTGSLLLPSVSATVGKIKVSLLKGPQTNREKYFINVNMKPIGLTFMRQRLSSRFYGVDDACFYAALIVTLLGIIPVNPAGFVQSQPFCCDSRSTERLYPAFQKKGLLRYPIYAPCSSTHSLMCLVYMKKKYFSTTQSPYCCQHLMKIYKFCKQYYDVHPTSWRLLHLCTSSLAIISSPATK